MDRGDILSRAQQCVCTDREQQYGNPEDNFSIISALWDNYLSAKRYSLREGFGINGSDVAVMMCLLKIGRIASGQVKEDNYIDLAGYAACAGEIAIKEDKP